MSLEKKKCLPCENIGQKLNKKEIATALHDIPNWVLTENNGTDVIEHTFKFKGFGKTMQFVNAVAWIATQEMHHPDLHVTYNTVTVQFTTHALAGVTENDLICAAKVNALIAD